MNLFGGWAKTPSNMRRSAGFCLIFGRVIACRQNNGVSSNFLVSVLSQQIRSLHLTNTSDKAMPQPCEPATKRYPLLCKDALLFHGLLIEEHMQRFQSSHPPPCSVVRRALMIFKNNPIPKTRFPIRRDRRVLPPEAYCQDTVRDSTRANV
jgi:hypothetical protein